MDAGKGWRTMVNRWLLRRWLCRGSGPGNRPGSRLRYRLESEDGMVTAELALTFPAVIMIVVALALTGSAGMAGIQVNAAARAACRSVAIGEDTASAIAAGTRLLNTTGSGTVTVGSSGKDVHCSAVKPMPAMLGMFGMTAKAEAVIPREDSW